MNGSGFDLVEHRVGQITGSFNESRNLLAEIEENLHALHQLRRGEADKIAEVDTELLRCSSSIQGGLDRIIRIRGNNSISSDDPILFVLDKAFESVEERLYKILCDAHLNNGFLDYGSLISAGQQTTAPVVVGLKDLATRLRSASGIATPSDLTPPTSGGDQPISKPTAQSGPLRMTRDLDTSFGSSRPDQHISPTSTYSSQSRKGSSLTTSSYSSSLYGSEIHHNHPDIPENQQFHEHEFRPLRTTNLSNSASRTIQGGNEHESKDRSAHSASYKSRTHSAVSQPHTISSIQEEISDLEIGAVLSSPNQRYAIRHFDSRNNSTSDDGAHIYGSSWKSSIITTPDTLPSPISPGFHAYSHGDMGSHPNAVQIHPAIVKDQPRESRMDRTKKHDSAEAVSPHSQMRFRQNIDKFGPPPAPPPARRLPEPPRPIKVSLFPAPSRRDRNRDPAAVPSHDLPKTDEKDDDDDGSHAPIPVSSLSSTMQPGLTTSPPVTNFTLPQKIGSRGPSHTPILASAPPPRSVHRPVGFSPVVQQSLNALPSKELPLSHMQYREPTLPSLLPENQVKTAGTRWFDNEELLPYPPPVRGPAPKTIAPAAPAPKSPIVETRRPRRDSKISLAQTTSSEGTMTLEKWLCITRSVKQIAGLPAPPVEIVPSTSASTRPADNLPNESNKFWTLCKNAVAMQIGEGKKSPDEVANRPAGITGNEKYMKCRKCKYEYSAFSRGGKGAMTDPRWKEGPNSLMYRETVLFKSHVITKKDKLPQEEYHFGCIFCAASGNGMPVFKGKTSFLHHLAEHGNGNYPSEVLKTRIKFIPRSEYKLNPQEDYFELALP